MLIRVLGENLIKLLKSYNGLLIIGIDINKNEEQDDLF